MKNRNQILRQEILDHKLEENVTVSTGATAVYAASLPPPTITFGRQIRGYG